MRLAKQEALENEKRTEMEDQSQKKINFNLIDWNLNNVNKIMIIDSYITLWH